MLLRGAGAGTPSGESPVPPPPEVTATLAIIGPTGIQPTISAGIVQITLS